MKVEITSKGAGRRFYFGVMPEGAEVEVSDEVGRQMVAQGLGRTVKRAVEAQPAKAAVIVKENDDG